MIGQNKNRLMPTVRDKTQRKKWRVTSVRKLSVDWLISRLISGKKKKMRVPQLMIKDNENLAVRTLSE